MQFFQETTKYKEDIPAGIYLLNDSKTRMYAFIPAGSGSVKTFKAPIPSALGAVHSKQCPTPLITPCPGKN